MRIPWGIVLDVLLAALCDRTGKCAADSASTQECSGRTGQKSDRSFRRNQGSISYHPALGASHAHRRPQICVFLGTEFCSKRLRIDSNATASLITCDRLHWFPKRANIRGNK
jgi:hypothetical protein